MDFVFEGVRPECLNGRFFNAKFDRKAGVLMIKEFFKEYISDKAQSYCLLDKRNIKVTFIRMDDNFCQTRILGQPACIGCRNKLLVFQYVTVDCRYIRFFVADLGTNEVTYFEDTQHYFTKDLVTVSPLECLICPDDRNVLIRLPQSVLTCRKWSKLMQLDFRQLPSQAVQQSLCRTFSVCGTVSSCLQDRKFQAVATHPMKPSVVVTALVDEFCSKCKFTVRDLNRKKIIMEKTHRLGRNSSAAQITKDESDENSEDEDDTYFLLQRCTATMSRQGDIFVLCCLVADNRQNSYLKVIIYDQDDFNCIGSHSVKLNSITLPLRKSELFSPVMSVCDTRCDVWHFKRGSTACKLLFSFPVTRRPNLKRQCRAIVLRNTPTIAIRSLPLPAQLLDFLSYCLLNDRCSLSGGQVPSDQRSA